MYIKIIKTIQLFLLMLLFRIEANEKAFRICINTSAEFERNRPLL